MLSLVQVLLLSSFVQISYGGPFLRRLFGKGQKKSDGDVEVAQGWGFTRGPALDSAGIPELAQSDPHEMPMEPQPMDESRALQRKLVSISQLCKRELDRIFAENSGGRLSLGLPFMVQCEDFDLHEQMDVVLNNLTLDNCLTYVPAFHKCLMTQLISPGFCESYNHKTGDEKILSLLVLIGMLPEDERIYFTNVIYFLRWVFEFVFKMDHQAFSGFLSYFDGIAPVDSKQETTFSPSDKVKVNKSANGQFISRRYIQSGVVRKALSGIVDQITIPAINSMIDEMVPSEEAILGASEVGV